ncbi:hypothetical protein [Salinarimonas ramus]|uniref:Cell division protein FtsB n=1 Tax=Salinarimonas ramus TaxID=690164 RepID=A0A917V2M0_9HYPH|nr:hypothetical protein [Salinarimonas ramus]GGK24151.1 hypothetical protein GCM10011322_08560 [Salinarimonas ramus]
MTIRILPAAMSALLLALSPAAAQAPGPLPLRTPAERTIDRTNRDLQLQRRLGEFERQQTFEEGQLRQRIDRLEMFPRLEPPPIAITPPGGNGLQ